MTTEIVAATTELPSYTIITGERYDALQWDENLTPGTYYEIHYDRTSAPMYGFTLDGRGAVYYETLEEAYANHG